MPSTLNYICSQLLRFTCSILYSICSILAPFLWTAVKYLWVALNYVFNLVFPIISYLYHFLSPVIIRIIYFISPIINYAFSIILPILSHLTRLISPILGYFFNIAAPIINYTCTALISIGEYLGIWSAAKTSLMYATYHYPSQIIIITLLAIIALSMSIQPILFCSRVIYFTCMTGIWLTQSLLNLTSKGVHKLIDIVNHYFPNISTNIRIQAKWATEQANQAVVKSNELLTVPIHYSNRVISLAYKKAFPTDHNASKH